MYYVVVLLLLVVIGYGLWRFAKHAKAVDEDIKYMNEGRGQGPGIFSIFRRDRS